MGAELTPVTTMETVAVSVPPFPSDTVYVKLSVPMAPGASPRSVFLGSYTNPPLAFIVTGTPMALLVAEFAMSTESVSPSRSVSLARTPTGATVSSSSSRVA